MKNRTQSGLVTTDLILEIFRANGELLAAGNRIAKSHGLTSARWQVMGAVDLAERPLTVSQISRRMGLARQGVQRIANELVVQGLLIAKDNIDHKNAKLFALTERGKKVSNKVDKAQIQWVNQFSKGLDEHKIKQAIKVLESVRQALETSPISK